MTPQSKVCERCGSTFFRAKGRTHASWAARRFCGHDCSRPANNEAWGTLEERFWRNVDTGSGCWTWLASRRHGYGQLAAGDGVRVLAAHRVSWEIHNGPIPEGLFVCHSCDNPGCVNPSHLFLGELKDNVADMVAKGRHPRGERNGMAKLTESDVVEIRRRYRPRVNSKELAAEFGITQMHLVSVAVGRLWKQVSA